MADRSEHPVRRLMRDPRYRTIAAGTWIAASGIAGILLAVHLCSGSPLPTRNLGGLVHSRAHTRRTLRPDRAARDPAELLRALTLPHHLVSAALGPHVFSGKSHLEVTRVTGGKSAQTKPQVVASLDGTTRIHIDAAGNYHAVLNNSQDYGREVYYVHGTLYLRPRYGAAYHRRPPTQKDEPQRIRDHIYATLGAYFELLAPAVAVTDEGAAEHAGRKVRKVAISLAKKPRPRPHEQRKRRKWREHVVVERASGRVLLDAKTGVPLSAHIAGRVAFTRDGNTFHMSLSADEDISAIGAAKPVKAPPRAQTVATPERSHDIEARNSLLEGIAPPARMAPTPSNPKGVLPATHTAP